MAAISVGKREEGFYKNLSQNIQDIQKKKTVKCQKLSAVAQKAKKLFLPLWEISVVMLQEGDKQHSHTLSSVCAFHTTDI